MYRRSCDWSCDRAIAVSVGMRNAKRRNEKSATFGIFGTAPGGDAAVNRGTDANLTVITTAEPKPVKTVWQKAPAQESTFAPSTPAMAEPPSPAGLKTSSAEAIAPASSVHSAPADPKPSPESKSLFISYRRQDSQHITGRIYDRLSTRFGKESVFKDVDSIPLGLDFRDHLREQVGQCALLVAVIGKNWNPPSASGQPRLSDPRDHLRIEIESALERSIPVIPVLVDGIEMPAEDEMPASLASLAYRNGIAVRPDPDFHHDLDRLVRGIEQILK